MTARTILQHNKSRRRLHHRLENVSPHWRLNGGREADTEAQTSDPRSVSDLTSDSYTALGRDGMRNIPDKLSGFIKLQGSKATIITATEATQEGPEKSFIFENESSETFFFFFGFMVIIRQI